MASELDELSRLRAENAELRRSNEKQRVIIEALQPDAAKIEEILSMATGVSPPVLITRDDADSLVPSDHEQVEPETLQRLAIRSHEEETTPMPALETDALQELAGVSVKVVGSRLKTNNKGKKVFAFILAIQKSEAELWRVEKLYSDFLALDARLKKRPDYSAIKDKKGKLPEKPIFQAHAASKADRRRVALERYLEHAVSQVQDGRDLCEFLSTDMVQREFDNNDDRKEGYLTKRGKTFGGWISRYFVLNATKLEYYEEMGGRQLGSIMLLNAVIERSVHPDPSTGRETGSYQSALLIREQKPGQHGSIKHILCAHSDDERDAWVNALVKKTTTKKDDIKAVSAMPIKDMTPNSEHAADFEKLTNTPTIVIPTLQDNNAITPSESSESNQSVLSTSFPSTSADQLHVMSQGTNRRSSMINMVCDSNPDSDTTLQTIDGKQKKGKPPRKNRMTFWGKRSTSGEEVAAPTPRPSTSSNTASSLNPRSFFFPRSSHDTARRKQSDKFTEDTSYEKVFEVTLEEAVRVSRVSEHCELPAVVFRCIEFLDKKEAEKEEGIYRISGRKSMLQQLKQQFNEEHDVDLLEYKDHLLSSEVADLLKTWLRELQDCVFTPREDFIGILDLAEPEERVNELGNLVSRLPLANYTLLRALMTHLNHIVQNESYNKMSIRNIRTIFAPTLRINPLIISLLMNDFEYIFWTTEDGKRAPPKQEEARSEEKTQPSSPLPSPSLSPSPSPSPVPLSPSPLLHKPLSRRPTLTLRETGGRSNRNSVKYMDNAPDAIVSLENKVSDSRTQPEGADGVSIEQQIMEDDDLILESVEEESHHADMETDDTGESVIEDTAHAEVDNEPTHEGRPGSFYSELQQRV